MKDGTNKNHVITFFQELTNADFIDPKLSKSISRKMLFLSKCVVHNRKKSRFIKEQEASGLLTRSKRMMLLSKCAVYNSKKSIFIEEQEVSGLLSKLGIKTPLRIIPLLGDNYF